MINMVIVEDSFDAREGLRYLLSLDNEIKILNTFDKAELLIANKQILSNTHVILMDIELLGMNGIEATKIIKEKYPTINILILTIFEEKEKIVQAIRAGASGYVLKNCDPRDLVSQIKSVFHGGSPISPNVARTLLNELYQQHERNKIPEDYNLTKREIEVCKAIINGQTYRQMAEDLHMASSTAKKHILNIYKKLQVNSKVTFMKKVLDENLIDFL
ncbi:MAG: response regulator transcription factor [Spirochaetia bacterium]|nr:response regulator transcription factor [Spirochaetia bacterium]